MPATRLTLISLEAREVPAAGVWSTETFDQSNQIPSNWSNQGPAFQIVSQAGVTGNALSTNATSRDTSVLWQNQTYSADTSARVQLLATTLVPMQLIVRGQNFGTNQASYYGVQITRGLQIELFKMVNGTRTTLATLTSKSYTSGIWIEVTLNPRGTNLGVQIKRLDNNQFLDSTGTWQSYETTALTGVDSSISTGGRVGLIRAARYAGRVDLDNFSTFEPIANLPSPTPPPSGVPQTFDAVPLNSIPNYWSSWGSDGTSGFGAAPPRVGTSTQVLNSTGSSARTARVWDASAPFTDATATATILLDSLIPMQVFVRGNNLNSATPSYYAVEVTRGLNIALVKVQNGQTQILETFSTSGYVSGIWADVSLTAQGTNLQVRIRRNDTGQWLSRDGTWLNSPTSLMDLRDTSLQGVGFAGLARVARYSGTVSIDRMTIRDASRDDLTPPIVNLTLSPNSSPLSGIVTFAAQVSDPSGIDRVEFLVDGELVFRDREAPYQFPFDTRNLTNGRHTFTVRVWDRLGNMGETSQVHTVTNANPHAVPNIPRHYSHIRIAALAYSGNPMGAVEQKLLRESVDIVVPNPRYLAQIDSISPETPQLIYSNISNLYLDLLTDWLNYADRNGLDRESAFYHVAQATPFNGSSPSSRPVNQFWDVKRLANSLTGSITDLTRAARGSDPNGISLGSIGSGLLLGYPEKFREINFDLRSAGSNWTGVLEVPIAVDSNGIPTAWRTISPVSNTTANMTRSGQITFDPPSDWVPAALPDSTTRYYYARLRTTSGTSPVFHSILGRDYVQARGTNSGMIPAFDRAADRNGDGYLSDEEYALRTAGFDARFVYESRFQYPYYGQSRYVTNPSGTGVSDWAADYHRRFLANYPLADGLFLDNSGGRVPIENAVLLESMDTYATDYGNMLSAVNRAIAPRWVIANTAGGGLAADRVTRQVPATLEEFMLRPLAHTWSQFLDSAALVSRRLSLTSPSGLMILDTLSTGGSPTDPRTQMAALAYYYLLSDPNYTALMLWGGEEPASTWSRHWFDAIATNIGQPQGTWSQWASGRDPANPAIEYRIYGREFDQAIVLYKPLSRTVAVGTGTLADNTATTHQLNGNYRLLNADGTLGPITNRVTLRNGEGAILMRA